MADLVDKIIQFESGDMSEEELIEFFQGLIDTDMAWKLQGKYGRAARELIEKGFCHPKHRQQ